MKIKKLALLSVIRKHNKARIEIISVQFLKWKQQQKSSREIELDLKLKCQRQQFVLFNFPLLKCSSLIAERLSSILSSLLLEHSFIKIMNIFEAS